MSDQGKFAMVCVLFAFALAANLEAEHVEEFAERLRTYIRKRLLFLLGWDERSTEADCHPEKENRIGPENEPPLEEVAST